MPGTLSKLSQARVWVYVVIDERDGTVVYVGQTEDIGRRWKEHERWSSKCALLRKWMRKREDSVLDGVLSDMWTFKLVDELPEGCLWQHRFLMEAHFISKYQTLHDFEHNPNGCNQKHADYVADHDPNEVAELLEGGYTFPDAVSVEPVPADECEERGCACAVLALQEKMGKGAVRKLDEIVDDVRVRVLGPAAQRQLLQHVADVRDGYKAQPAWNVVTCTELVAELNGITTEFPNISSTARLKIRDFVTKLHPDKSRTEVNAGVAYHLLGLIWEFVAHCMEAELDASNEDIQFFFALRAHLVRTGGKMPVKAGDEKELNLAWQRWSGHRKRPLRSDAKLVLRHFEQYKSIAAHVFAGKNFFDADASVSSLRKLLVQGYRYRPLEGRHELQLSTAAGHKAEYLCLHTILNQGQYPDHVESLLSSPEGQLTEVRIRLFRERIAKTAESVAARKRLHNQRDVARVHALQDALGGRRTRSEGARQRAAREHRAILEKARSTGPVPFIESRTERAALAAKLKHNVTAKGHVQLFMLLQDGHTIVTVSHKGEKGTTLNPLKDPSGAEDGAGPSEEPSVESDSEHDDASSDEELDPPAKRPRPEWHPSSDEED